MFLFHFTEWVWSHSFYFVLWPMLKWPNPIEVARSQLLQSRNKLDHERSLYRLGAVLWPGDSCLNTRNPGFAWYEVNLVCWRGSHLPIAHWNICNENIDCLVVPFWSSWLLDLQGLRVHNRSHTSLFRWNIWLSVDLSHPELSWSLD